MRKVFLSIVCTVTFSGCSSFQTQHISEVDAAPRSLELPQNAVKPKEPALPNWIVSTEPDRAVGCAQIKNGNIVMAKQVSLAKAKAEYLSQHNTDVEAITSVSESANTKNGSTEHNSSVNTEIRLKTQGAVNHSQKIHQQEKVDIENQPHWCVLYGSLKPIITTAELETDYVGSNRS